MTSSTVRMESGPARSAATASSRPRSRGGVVYAQSTQAEHEVQKFSDGAGYRIPASARIISDIHTLNTTGSDVTGSATLTIHAVPEEEIAVKLAPFHVNYHELTIQPLSTSRFTGECDLRSAYQGGPLSLDICYVLPHTHALGVRMFVEGAQVCTGHAFADDRHRAHIGLLLLADRQPGRRATRAHTQWGSCMGSSGNLSARPRRSFSSKRTTSSDARLACTPALARTRPRQSSWV